MNKRVPCIQCRTPALVANVARVRGHVLSRTLEDSRWLFGRGGSCVHRSSSCGVHRNGSCGARSARSSGGSISHDHHACARGCVATVAAQLPQVTIAVTVYQVSSSHSHVDLDHPGAYNARDDGWHLPLHREVQRACSVMFHAAIHWSVGRRSPPSCGTPCASRCHWLARTTHHDRQAS